jgi:hypothetical protein
MAQGFEETGDLVNARLTKPLKNKKMKQIVLTIVLYLSSFYCSASCMKPVDGAPEQAFKKDFSTAKDIKWEVAGTFRKVTFSIGQEVIQAYYSENGNLISVVRNITSEQLPLILLLEIKMKYTSFWITNLSEVVNGNEHAYYLTLENADKVVIMKSKDDESNWLPYALYSKS